MAVSPTTAEDAGTAMRELTRFESPSMSVTIENDIGLIVSHADGPYLWDRDGRRYLDLTAGSGVHALGHGDPGLLTAMAEQLHSFAHGGWQLGCPARAELSGRLAELLPWPDPVLLYCTTGSEAVEGALKVARAATGRRQILGFLGGYHGKTGGSLAVTANSSLRRDVTELPTAAMSLPYPSAGGYLTAEAVPSGAEFAWGQEILEHPDFGLDDVAALVVEPVQGAGGMLAASPGWLAHLREFTRKHGILLVLDEIYTGFGRTGSMFGFQHDGVVPDLVVLGKALGGGLPVSLVAGPRAVMKRIAPLRQTSTFSANPVACAAGNYVVRRVVEDDLSRRAAETGDALAAALAALRIPGIEITLCGRGLMLGARVHTTGGAGFVKAVVARMRELGVLVLRGGPDGEVVKLTPPLTLPADAATAAIEAFAKAIRDELTR
ncbi:aspartate aminotransferase family protein [Amycolatopsis panacis]|uniref:Aspartate aminotransferase family protein n=1 Tax=Amycolatopsis panacis TaxID=2340917 RepID=A0A419HQZ0_9PSEU|nr:aspartate aminotransferase family protein [Amycolatopsis panacis]RJQ78875.1 aspartate aminotransferase family protein [Amycolatopsis panacis]